MRAMLLAIICLLVIAFTLQEPSVSGKSYVAKRIFVRTYNGQGSPQVDLAPELRQKNWSTRGGGSCVYATLITLCQIGAQSGNPELAKIAADLRANYGGGESLDPLIENMEAIGLKYVATGDADEELLDWALRTRRGAGVTWGGAHCVTLVGKSNGNAIILDNNRPNEYIRQPWDEFLREWRRCGAWAFALVYEGMAPAP